MTDSTQAILELCKQTHASVGRLETKIDALTELQNTEARRIDALEAGQIALGGRIGDLETEIVKMTSMDNVEEIERGALAIVKEIFNRPKIIGALMLAIGMLAGDRYDTIMTRITLALFGAP